MKKRISSLYEFDQNCSQEYIRKCIKWLLAKYRFTCRVERREASQWLFNVGQWGSDVLQGCDFRFHIAEAIQFIYNEFNHGPKKLGNHNQAFITKISSRFICLIFSVLYHTLQWYETGEYVVCVDFNHHNSRGTSTTERSVGMLMNWIGTYIRLCRQWKGMPTSMQQTLLGVIRVEVVRICKKHHHG